MPASLAFGMGAAAVAGVAAGALAYAARWPASQLFGATLIAPPRPGEIALTFDDGPNPACTPRLLDVLAHQGVKATFFLIGQFAQQEPALTRSLAEAGHSIGNHTWSHPNLSVTPARRVLDELVRTKDTLEQVTGKAVGVFRPPFGARRPYVLRAARQLGMVPVMWNAMTTDWSERNSDCIYQRLARKVEANQRRGLAANIVLHDGGHLALNTDRNPSIGAAEQLLRRYAPSHKFVTVSAWL